MKVTTSNPATGVQRALDLDETTVGDVWSRVERASAVAEDYAGRALEWRAEMLRAMADELEADTEVLVATAAEETALGLARLRGELKRTAFQLRFFADVVTEGTFLHATVDHATDSPMGPLPDLRRMLVALGPVAVFGSSNFPFAFSVPGGDTASALAAGCPVVLKAHPAHPATSAATFATLERAARRCDAPEGTLGIVFGLEAGVALVEAPGISAVGFTGSVAAGRALWVRVLRRTVPIPFYGELGAANPLVVTPHAATERGAQIGTGVAGSMTLGVGQFCTKPGLLFVPAGEGGDALVGACVAALGDLGGFTMLSAGIAEHFRAGARRAGAVAGVRALVNQNLGEAAQTSAQLYEVDAVAFATPGAGALREECFGPLAIVVRYSSNDELREALWASEPALTFSLFVGDDDPAAASLLELGSRRAGRVTVNEFPTGVGVSWSMQHGGPWPATTSAASTSVGAAAIQRWLRPVAYQAVPDALLPAALQESNPLAIPRRVDGRWPA